MDILNKLRLLADQKHNSSGEEKYRLIKEMLKDDDCFFHITSSTALTILNDLDIPEEKALGVYERLISPKSYKEIQNTHKIVVK